MVQSQIPTPGGPPAAMTPPSRVGAVRRREGRCPWRHPAPSNSSRCNRSLDSPLTRDTRLLSVSEELITIGTFSMLTGLSISTLRHYDDIGLISPAEVDRQTSYRRYSSTQVERARRVRLLREAEVPTDLIAQALDGDDLNRRTVLARHPSALRERAGRAEEVLNQLLDDSEDRSQQMTSASDFGSRR